MKKEIPVSDCSTMRLVLRANGPVDFGRTIELHLLENGEQGGCDRVGSVVTMVPLEDGDRIQPTFRLPMSAAQGLMDDLWRCGFRPSEGSGSAGALAATERHLKDLQALIFKGPWLTFQYADPPPSSKVK